MLFLVRSAQMDLHPVLQGNRLASQDFTPDILNRPIFVQHLVNMPATVQFFRFPNSFFFRRLVIFHFFSLRKVEFFAKHLRQSVAVS